MAKLTFNATVNAEQLPNGDLAISFDLNGESYALGTMVAQTPAKERPEHAAARHRTPAEHKGVADAAEWRNHASLIEIQNAINSHVRRVDKAILFADAYGKRPASLTDRVSGTNYLTQAASAVDVFESNFGDRFRGDLA